MDEKTSLIVLIPVGVGAVIDVSWGGGVATQWVWLKEAQHLISPSLDLESLENIKIQNFMERVNPCNYGEAVPAVYSSCLTV